MIASTDLNHNQQRVLEWDDGPLLVLGGPGSGKTAVLTLRATRLLREDEDTSVLALTFTDKVAAEMRDRVDLRIGGLTQRMRFYTFYDFAIWLLKYQGGHVNISSTFCLLTRDEDRVAVLEEVIRDLPRSGAELPQDRINLLRLIDLLFSESYEGDGPSRSLKTTPTWLPHLFRQYCDALVSVNCLDFGSLLHFSNRLLRQKPMVARLMRLAWENIFVDEFQDTNQAQYDLVRLMAPNRNHNLFVTADENHAMYQWNGSSSQRFDDLRRDYELEVIQLPENYHCPSKVMAYANQLTGFNKTYQVSGDGAISTSGIGVVRHMVFENSQQEVEFVGRDIYERRLSLEDCVVLGRTNRLVENAAKAIERTGHTALVSRTKYNFQSPSLGVLMEVLRLANSPHDRAVLQRLCQRWERLTGKVMESHAVEYSGALVGGDFLRAWVDSVSGEEEGMGEVLDEIRNSLVDSMEFPKVVNSFLADGWKSWGDKDSDGILQEEIAIWRSLHQEILESCGSTVTLNTYLHHFDMVSKPSEPTFDAIRCMTLDQSKGLQFKHVYLTGMAQEEFPSSQALRMGQDSPEMQREQRNCFAAITRVQETLTLTRARKYHGCKREPSQFLSEMGLFEIEEDVRPEGSSSRGLGTVSTEVDQGMMAGAGS